MNIQGVKIMNWSKIKDVISEMIYIEDICFLLNKLNTCCVGYLLDDLE